MKILIFIDPTSANTHKSIINKSIGASEYQYYNLIHKLSNYFKIICFYNGKETKEIDNIKYESLYDNFTNFNVLPEYIFVIQRFMPKIESEIYNKIKNNKIYVWNHDIISDTNFFWSYEQNDKEKYKNKDFFKNNLLKEFFNNKNINFIFVSKTIKNDFKKYMINYGFNFEIFRLHYIYNILYEDEFLNIKNINIIQNKYLITYASALHKGIEKIIPIFDKLLLYDNNFILQIMSPGYEWQKWQEYLINLKNKYGNNINIIGPVNKNEYGEKIKNSLCVLSGTFYETFGCVFAESYFLEIPVIADYRSGAVKEIIDNDYITNYDNIDETITKILKLHNIDKLKITLNNKFLLNFNLSKWLKKLNGMDKSLYKEYNNQYNFEGGCWNKSTCLKDGKIETYSGPGSLIENTDLLVEKLNIFLKKYKIKSMIDVPCGDFNFMSKINLNNINYMGYDISKNAIKKCKNFEKDNIKFMVYDATIEKIPYADLIFCKDLFLHLSFNDTHKILNNIIASGCKYFAVSRYSFGNVSNKEQNSGLGCRAIEITKEPFNFNYPIIETYFNTSKFNTHTWMSDQMIFFKLV
jgi:hypothetical protein